MWDFLTLCATFKIAGKTSVEDEMLNISVNWLEISFSSNVYIFIGIQLGATDLFESSEDIMFCISELLVGLRKKELRVLFLRKYDKCSCKGLTFSFAFSTICCK